MSLTRPETGAEADAEAGAATEASGLAHLAAVSYLGSRLAPTGGYWVALAGGVAVARAAARHGLRVGLGATIAGLAQSVAVMGPARLSIALTQAVTAPLLGRLHARGAGVPLQVVVAAAIRIGLALMWTAFFIWVIIGGLGTYVGGYDWLLGTLPFLPQGQSGVLVLSIGSIVVWALFSTPIQVLVYRRGLRRWPADLGPAPDARPPPREPAARRRLDPRAVTLAATVAWILLLAGTDWPLLVGVAAWLALAWVVARPERDFVPVGLAIALVLGLSALVVGLMAGVGVGLALERATRAALLVLVATWFRGACGSAGIREVSRRILGRLRRVLPGASEAAGMLGDLGSADAIVPAGRALGDALRDVEHKPRPVLDAVLGWVVEESRRFRPAAPAAPPPLGVRPFDVALVVAAALPVLALLTGAAGLGSGP